jgi:CTP synthase (UTP-ammonia lyase)
MRIPVRLALVGDRSLDRSSHLPVTTVVAGLGPALGGTVEATWFPTDQVGRALEDVDGIWLTGSPYESEAGVIAAAGIARRYDVPLLGTCGGFQLAVVEFATAMAGLAEEDVLTPLSCSLGANECRVRAVPGSLFARALGAERTRERYHCTFGLNPTSLPVLTGHGLRFTGFDDDGVVRVAELPTHPFFLGTLFQPELAGGTDPHPIIRAWATAAAARCRRRAAPFSIGPPPGR